MFFAKPTFTDPHQFLDDFKVIECYEFGRWRPVAIIIWGVLAIATMSHALILWNAHLSGADVFIKVHLSLMSNLSFGHSDTSFNIPLIEPAAYLCFAAFVWTAWKTLKALFVKTAVRKVSHFENPAQQL